MNRSLYAGLVLLLGLANVRADTICQWNFNSTIPDSDSSTGITSPATGSGIASLVGGTTGSFVTGGTADPVTSDDSAWSTTKYPSTLLLNCTAGVRFSTSTEGFENITISWAQQNSATASRYVRAQYTLDGVNFINLPAITIVKDGVYTNLTADLSGIAGANNNPLFGFQILAEFESTARPPDGLPGYIATGSGSEYGPSGIIKFDMVTISGRTIGDWNTPPYIFPQIGDQVLAHDQVSAALPFTVLDAEEPAANLEVRKSSSNSTVLPLGNIVIGGTGANRNVTVEAAGVAGTSRIGLVVVDSGGKSNSMAFDVTVLPANSSPVISGITFVHTVVDVPTGALAFSVSDAESAPSALAVSATATDSLLVPPSNLVLSGSGSNRSLSITPGLGRTGVTPITVSVSDGENVSSAVFPLMVMPSPSLIFWEPFNYANSALTTNSGLLWGHRSGTAGDCQASNQMLRLSDKLTEDVGAALIGAPYEPGTGAVLYVSFRLRVSGLPKALPDYFSHFLVGNTAVGRISVGTTNAVEGCYRVYAGNGPNEVPVCFPMSMDLNKTYLVVEKYEVDTAQTTLWVNPATEQSASVTASDAQQPGKVSTFGFRQSSGIGPELLIDDLKAGLSFASVTETVALPPLLGCSRAGGKVRLVWSNPAHKLQCSATLGGNYTNVTAATSPYDTSVTGPSAFFRLKAD